MEKSIKRVEKLVHATNTALAQMKHSLMFDDTSEGLEFGSGKIRKKDVSGSKFLDGEDLRVCQDEFRNEADEMLAKMDKLFGQKVFHRKRSKTLERIKEINKKLTANKSDAPETQQSRHKLLTLINQELSPRSKSSGDKPPALRLEKPPTPVETEVHALRKSPSKSKEELKTKILETQEIVDRGFQTARQLTQKVENMSKKTPSETDTKKSEHSDTLKSRCEKCAERRRMKTMRQKDKEDKRIKKDKEAKVVEEVKEDNVRVLEVKDVRVPVLQIQRLPSLHIKDGLRLQKVHDVEIPANDPFERVNTANVILTHEDVEKEKREKEINQMRLNNLLSEDKSNSMECFNCGKLIKTRQRVDPKRVDDVLRMCNFNVFDPRIDEFAERGYIQEEPIQERVSEKTVIEKSHRKTRKLQEFSEYLAKLYKQEAETLEDNHLRLDSILQNLFKKVDESREMFENCCLLKRETRRLSVTKPVTISVVDTQKRMDKKDVKNRSKSRTALSSSGSSCEVSPRTRQLETFQEEKQDTKGTPKTSSVKPNRPKAFARHRKVSRPTKRTFRKSVKPSTKTKIEETIRKDNSKSPEIADKSTSSSIASKNTQQELSPPRSFKQVEESKKIEKTEESEMNHVTSKGVEAPLKVKESVYALDPDFGKPKSPVPEVPEMSPPSSRCKREEVKPTSPKSEKSDDYESDFEGESEPKLNKLSTILEVDSEPEKKQTTPSQGTTPTELVSSLKEVLSALKDQFKRTETLAEKLTENIPQRKDSPKLWTTDSELMINLQSARKVTKDTKPSRSPIMLASKNRKSDDLSIGSLSEGGSSIGEVITRRKSDSSISENLPSGRRSRVSSGRRDATSFQLKLNDDVSYSEGEIPSNVLLNSEANSVRSVGEVASEKTSGTSSVG